ncbi:hypothetical protein EV645_6291 [Kribbella rubisoli]|uniref:VOC domain-containing protein n=1 Tax=Kribbella rubisoli TaxID=3075929 RepID=A0A4Q7WM19_9ACTN|nr:hypothetical protein EV645_6291 [Kribbella rubisoli]
MVRWHPDVHHCVPRGDGVRRNAPWASIGTGITDATPGSACGVLKVDDLESARAELEACGAALSPVSRCETGEEYVELCDPHGNRWLVMVTEPLSVVFVSTHISDKSPG